MYIHVEDSRPNGWTDWAEVFLWALRGGRGVLLVKKIKNFLKTFFSRATPGPSVSSL